MAFKCHTRLDSYVIITLRAHPCTSHHKHRSPLCFVKSNALWSQESRKALVWAPKSPPGAEQSLRSTSMQSSNLHLFLSLSSLPFPPGKWFGEGWIMRSQTPVIWQRITQMGQTEPAEPTGSWEWWCTGCFLSTGCAVAQKLHRLTHQTEPLKEGLQRETKGDRGTEMGAARSRGGTSICTNECRLSWSGKWGKKEKWSRFVGQQRRRKKKREKNNGGII